MSVFCVSGYVNLHVFILQDVLWVTYYSLIMLRTWEQERLGHVRYDWCASAMSVTSFSSCSKLFGYYSFMNQIILTQHALLIFFTRSSASHLQCKCKFGLSSGDKLEIWSFIWVCRQGGSNKKMHIKLHCGKCQIRGFWTLTHIKIKISLHLMFQLCPFNCSATFWRYITNSVEHIFMFST